MRTLGLRHRNQHRSAVTDSTVPDTLRDKNSHPIRTMPRLKLDDIDLRILAALQADGRMTNRVLAERVGLTPSPCHARLRRLIDGGVIDGFHASLNLKALSPLTLFFVEVTLREHNSTAFRQFEAAIARAPEVIECHGTGGGFDYLMKVAAHGVEDYQAFIQRLLDAEIGIGKYFSYVVTNVVKSGGALPVTPASTGRSTATRSRNRI